MAQRSHRHHHTPTKREKVTNTLFIVLILALAFAAGAMFVYAQMRENQRAEELQVISTKNREELQSIGHARRTVTTKDEEAPQEGDASGSETAPAEGEAAASEG